ncbi:MAG: electron transfer flavoprotein-ubiquinone oxidoreductase [Acidobacteria bacterium]|nr:electron transfer flavoprotein-ubiquinone oxidoreductase [Acidobacteriota bacterium]MBI3658311.1 electron transfer flavoprotein-ubiquinone oxidoreductase [Acidobacteriota bacterium]
MGERESLEFDILFVGAGPASLCGAIYLSRLVEKHNRQVESGSVSGERLQPSIAILEKGAELGAHSLSGAVLDPIALHELFTPEELSAAPLDTKVKEDFVYYLTANSKIRIPTPPALHNVGLSIISLGKLVKWLGTHVEACGIDIFPGFAGRELLYEGHQVVGVRTGDMGIDKKGQPKSNYQPGMDVRAKVTVLGEGSRGSLTKTLINKFHLDRNINPQVYAIGVKELWEIPAGTINRGTVIHTMGWPLKSDTFGGSFVYSLEETLLSIGLVIGLDYKDPYLDPQNEFNRFKTHPLMKGLLKGGKVIKYGAKTLPEGGYYAMPRLTVDGALVIGDSGGFLNPQRLKGIHMAMKSGMLAAETIFEALKEDKFSEAQLQSFHTRIENSWIKKELYQVRNFHQNFEHGLWVGMFHTGLQMFTGGRGLIDPMRSRAGHEYMKKVRDYWPTGKSAVAAAPIDGSQTFDKLTDVHHSATDHEEDQPIHLLVRDYNICHTRCREEYDNPCQRFCPAAVYEMVDADGSGQTKLQINASNCVHCKTCDIMDPYQIIDWVPPEGGGGPGYEIL